MEYMDFLGTPIKLTGADFMYTNIINETEIVIFSLTEKKKRKAILMIRNSWCYCTDSLDYAQGML